MEKIGLIIDSTVYLSETQIKDNDIAVVSLNVIDGETTYKETDITSEFAYKRQDENARLTTSQPSPQEFLDAYQAMFDKGYEKLIVICLSKNISGTYQSAVLAVKMIDRKDDIYVFDTLQAAYGNEMIALEALKLRSQELAFDALVEAVNLIISKSGLFFTVENLHSLQKGGRLSKVQAFVGTALRIKPIIRMEDGKLNLWHKERTYIKVIDKMITTLLEDGQGKGRLHVRIINKNSSESVELLRSALQQNFADLELTEQDYLGPVFAIHVGKKGFGVSWFFEEK